MAEVSGCDLIVGVVSVEALAYCKMGTLGCILEKSTLPMNLFSLVKSRQQPRVHSSEWPCLSLFLLVGILLMLPLNFCLFLEDFSNFFSLYIAVGLPIYTIGCFSEYFFCVSLCWRCWRPQVASNSFLFHQDVLLMVLFPLLTPL